MGTANNLKLQPRLIETAVPENPDGVVLVLHGGDRRRDMVVRPTQLAVVLTIPIAHRIARAGRGRLAVFRLLNSRRGWGTDYTPVDDAHWALDQITKRMGRSLATCLVGHSLGGRAALLAAGRSEVRSVVALAPWVHPNDVVTGLSGKQILIVHGLKDRIAPPSRSAALARNLNSEAVVSYIAIEDGGHAMLRHRRLFSGLAADFAATTLLGTPATGPIARTQAGERVIRL